LLIGWRILDTLRIGRNWRSFTETQRQAIELHYIVGMTITEVAEHLQCTSCADAGLLNGGLKKLRELMKGPDAEPA
jgi:DNA-directed RNA polymerase specialized sigma24 family protein